MWLLVLETINVNYSTDQWLQVFTDGSFVEKQANVGAEVYSELFTFLTAAGQNRSAFEGEIGVIKTALGQLCCCDAKFTNAVILSVSQSAIQSIGSREPSKTAETHECKNLYQVLKEKNKTIAFQWITGHCGIIGNERADTFAKKGTTILQPLSQPISFYTMKTLIKREFKTLRTNELKARTKEKQLGAVAEFRLRTGRGCLAKHLQRIGVYAQPTYSLCDLQEEMEKTHLIRFPALQTTTETQRYWEARSQLMG
nr:reverse transcriptase [Hymenolepis microstoma]